MKMIALLDCTLRDGGYINDWRWGFSEAKTIIRFLVRANIDVVEVGFLRNVDDYSPDISVCNRIEELNLLLPEDAKNTCFSAMAMRSNYDIDKLSDYSGSGISIIRVTAHENDIYEGIEFARQVKEKGYRVSINPINIMGYSDDELLRILESVNKAYPYQFAIVDTFGSMKRRDLDRIVSLVDHNLERDIRVAIHLHENMAQSFSLAQSFVDKRLNRATAIDGSLLGMGRTPGNLPIELIADYLNEYFDGNYDIDFLLDAIQDHIGPIKGEPEWGYNPAYFLSARYNLHRNYAEYYLKKGDLIARDINHLLSRFDASKAAVFDRDYAEGMYQEFLDNEIDDSMAKAKLSHELEGKPILILAPGKSIVDEREKVENFIAEHNPAVIAVNFPFENYKADYIFFGNNRRYNQAGALDCAAIATSNVKGHFDYYINHNNVAGSYKYGNNTLIMLISLLQSIGCGKDVFIAGADGYQAGKANYYKESIISSSIHEQKRNLDIAAAILKTGVPVRFITKSKYEEYIK